MNYTSNLASVETRKWWSILYGILRRWDERSVLYFKLLL